MFASYIWRNDLYTCLVYLKHLFIWLQQIIYKLKWLQALKYVANYLQEALANNALQIELVILV